MLDRHFSHVYGSTESGHFCARSGEEKFNETICVVCPIVLFICVDGSSVDDSKEGKPAWKLLNVMMLTTCKYMVAKGVCCASLIL